MVSIQEDYIMDRQLSNFDIAICILVPLVLAALGFVAHQLEGHDERIIALEKPSQP